MTKGTADRTFFDISDLLTPIKGDNPCGKPLRYTDVYDQIREARREEDPILSQGVWKTDPKKANWEQVDKLCQNALKYQSKDLQLAIWLTEAHLHLRGIPGLAHGLRLLHDLSRTYWKDFYPPSKGEDDLRIGLYIWVNKRLGDQVLFSPISLPTKRNPTFYRLFDLEGVTFPTLESSAPSDDRATEIRASLMDTPLDYYIQMQSGCKMALKAIRDLEKELHRHLHHDAPTFPHLREKIDALCQVVQNILNQRTPPKGEKTMKAPAPSRHSSPKSTPPESSLVPIRNRDQAYATLAHVAAYLEKIEPHSPTPYLIHRAIAWGNMTLSEVVSNLLQEEGNLSFLLDILNVNKEGTPERQTPPPEEAA